MKATPVPNGSANRPFTNPVASMIVNLSANFTPVPKSPSSFAPLRKMFPVTWSLS